MFGKECLLSVGYRSAAVAQFEAELAQAREARNAARGWRAAIIAGAFAGLAIAAVLFVCGVL